MRAAEPLYVVPDASPAPPLLNVTELVTEPAVVALVAVVAVVAVVADVALPDRLAVMVPALKLPDASRATMVDAVFKLVALEVTVNVDEPD